MKKYRITYFIQPDGENIVIEIWAKSYEDACIYAKDYRKEGFTVEELKGEHK